MQDNIFFFLKNKKQTKYLYDNLSFSEALTLMRTHGFTAIPDINLEGEYVGTVTEGDFLYYMMDHPSDSREEIKNTDVSRIVRKNFMPPVPFNVPMSEVFQQSLSQNFVPVVDDRNIFIGIVTRKAIISYLMHPEQ